MNEQRLASRERYIERLLSEASTTNRDLMLRYMTAKRASGLKSNSLINTALALSHLDAEAAGTPIPDLTPEALTAILERYTRTHQASSVNSWAAVVRGFFRWHNQGELPKSITWALKRQHKAFMGDFKVLTEQDLQALLQAADRGPQRGTVAKRQALINLLWDSGFRISEAMSLQIGDFQPDERQGANLRLVHRHGADLKTGPRTIYVLDCVPALKVWLEFHPDPGNVSAPLFPGHRNHEQPMWPNNVATLLRELAEQAGISHVHPHLFRHARATRAAIMGWNEPQMRAYFGWSSGSAMPGHYIHLSQRNMEDRVRQDAGADAMGRRAATQMTEADFDNLLKRRLKKLLMEDS